MINRFMMNGSAGIQSARRKSSAGWTPANLFPEGWFRADLGITESGGSVSAWANQGTSGSAGNLSQATSTRRPSLTSSFASLNNQAVLYFDGNDVLYSAASSWWHIPDGNSFISILVFRPESISGITQPLITRSYSTQGGFAHRIDTDGRFYVYEQGVAQSDLATYTAGYSAGSNYVSAGLMRENGASADDITLYINGSECDNPVIGSYEFGDIAATSAREFLVGAATPAGAAGLTGWIAEVIHIKRELTSGEDASLKDYLNNRYGFSLTSVTQ